MKKGDKVVCIKTHISHIDGTTVIEGDEYSVVDTMTDGDGLNIKINGADKFWWVALWNFRKAEPQSFKAIAEKGLEHLETERSPHRKTVTDPAKERVFSLTEKF